MGGNFKFQVQDSFLEYFFFQIWRSKKRIALSEKKPPLIETVPVFQMEMNSSFFMIILGMEVQGFSLSHKNGGNIVEKELITIWLERKTTLLPKLMSEELVFQVS